MRKSDPIKFQAKRLEILKAAEQCFARKGFHGATIADVCAEAKISPGHLYHYFSSKEAILRAMAEVSLEYAQRRFSKLVERSDVISAFVDAIEQDRVRDRKRGSRLLSEVLAEASRNPAIATILQGHSRGLVKVMTRLLRSGQKQGQIDPGLDAKLAATILMGLLDGSSVFALRYPKLSPNKSLRHLKLMVVRFLSPPR